MGTRIHRAIGYGMPWGDFVRRLRLPVCDDGPGEALWEKFHSLSDADLTVPRETYEKLFYAAGDAKPPIILETRLLARNYTDGGRREADLGRAEDLYALVRDPDETHHIVFFPNLAYARSWRKRDETIDYVFEQWRDVKVDHARKGQAEPRSFARYVGYGHYPLTNNLMAADGAPVPWRPFWEVEEHPEWLPAVPSEIRWYLTTHGVLDDAGVNALRPIVAQWWC